MKPDTITITGTLIDKGLTVQRGRFNSREIVVRDDDTATAKHPSVVTLTAEDDDVIAKCDQLRPQTSVTVEFTVRGVEFISKRDGALRRFNKLYVRSIRPADAPAIRPEQPKAEEPPYNSVPVPPNPMNNEDLPF